jgi:sterol desaturase/sphingolipid hydroxylase (fatty acid hydroxylase superfamily)
LFDAVLQWLRATYDPAAIWASSYTIVVSYILWSVAERVYPAERGQPIRLAFYNVWITVVYILLTRVSSFIGGSGAAFAVSKLGGPIFALDLEAWLAALAVWAQYISLIFAALIPVLIYDFFYYWFHRWQHEWSWLWQVHKLHHTDLAVNVTTSNRHNWLEEFFRGFLLVLPMTLLVKITPAHAGFLAVVIGEWGSFIHANVRLNMGPLTGVLSGPQYHRIHHSIEPRHWNKNYAAFFPFWDWIFGTMVRPQREDWPKTGIAGESGSPSVWEVLAGPFVEWFCMLRRSLTKVGTAPHAQVEPPAIGKRESELRPG